MIDLTQRPPRSPRARLGGFVTLPRILDKCRAEVAGKFGDYKFNCPLDQRFFSFVQVDAAAFKTAVQSGKGDGEMLEWVRQNAKRKLDDSEIASWSCHQEYRVPADTESREFFQKIHQQVAAKRDDVVTWFDLLDLDDYVSFGGKA